MNYLFKNSFVITILSAVCLFTSIFAQEILNKNEITNLISVPLTRQSTDYTCGVAVMQSILGYYGDDVREDKLAKALGADTKNGTDYKNSVTYAKSKGYEVTIYNDMTLEQLQECISKGQPVICAIQAWSEKPSDYKKDWEDGHYVIAVGYDKERIYFMDPATLGNYTYIPIPEFLDRWHDVDQRGDKLIHFGMVITKTEPAYHSEDVKYLE
jgi:predicted double-glycine peptidase